MAQHTLMFVLAHPDDEAFGVGGSMSRYAAEGAEVYLVTATRGEAGQIMVPDLATKANLPEVREAELRCACQTYGIRPPHLLGYIDGQLPIVHQGQAVAKVVRLIRELRPQVVVTFGPDGIYGHYDHIAAHRWATIAVELAAQPDCFPNIIPADCSPHTVAKLYYHVLAQDAFEAREENGRADAVMMDGVPFPVVSYPAEQITTVIDISAYARTKLAGIQCHRSQFTPDDAFFASDSEEVLRQPSFTRETFILARSTVPRPPGIETDLFAGLD